MPTVVLCHVKCFPCATYPFMWQPLDPTKCPCDVDCRVDPQTGLSTQFFMLATFSSLSKHRPPPKHTCVGGALPLIERELNEKQIGSTPNPVRRLRQHNGEISAGAQKTQRGRPWDMTMIVHGFPSRLAALQFEWAWQHPYKARTLKDEDGGRLISRSSTVGLRGRIRTVRFMVATYPYSNWPLHVKLFAPEAVKAWQNVKNAPDLPRGFTSTVELEGVDGTKQSVHGGSGRTGPIDILDSVFTQRQLKVYDAILRSSRHPRCSVCQSQVEIAKEDPLKFAACTTPSCHTITHMTCLASAFLQDDPQSSLIPRGGICSGCRNWTLWGDIVKGAHRRKDRGTGVQYDEDESNDESSPEEDDVEEVESTPTERPSKAIYKQKSLNQNAETKNTSQKRKNSTQRPAKKTAIVQRRRRSNDISSKTSSRQFATSSKAINGHTIVQEEPEDFGDLMHIVDESDESDRDLVRQMSGVSISASALSR